MVFFTPLTGRRLSIYSWHQCFGSRPFWYGIRIMLFTLMRIPTILFTLVQIRIQLFHKDPDPYSFKELMYLKWYFLFILTWLSLSVGPQGPNQQAYIVKFSLIVDFAVLIRVGYGSERLRSRNNAWHCSRYYFYFTLLLSISSYLQLSTSSLSFTISSFSRSLLIVVLLPLETSGKATCSSVK